MQVSNQRWVAAILFSSVVLAMGCERAEKAAPDDTPRSEGSASQEKVEDNGEAAEKADEPAQADARRATADKADLMLRQRLMGRVMETAKAEGFAAAVNVCHGEAGPLTQEVGDAMDVKIGRVADRLRNPENTGPGWVAPMIEEADGKAHYVATDDTLRAIKPIPIAENCLNCHGQTDQLAEGVSEALQEHYPDDKATGYALGDLRGWVWVEVL